MEFRYQKKLDCLGSQAFLTIITDQGNNFKDEIFKELINKINVFENAFSRFLSQSELTKFNELAGKKTKISPEFRDILIVTKKMSELTNNIFTPFILPSLQKAGYITSWTNKDVVSPDFKNRINSPDFSINIGSDWAEIPKDSALDLGGIGKGYLLDQLSDFLKSKKIDNYWLSLGGDIICDGQDINNKPWCINCSDAINTNLTIDSIENTNGRKLAIATSGVTKRKGFRNNKAWNHIIDPKTNEPISSNILTVTVTANNAVTADVMAKYILIEGLSKAKQLIEDGQINGFLVQSLGFSSKIEVVKDNIN
ncbi:MAG: FAD:protein FMN transferase [bacterium]